jgi:hypothetical protein
MGPVKIILTEEGYIGGGEDVHLVCDRKIVFNPGKNVQLTLSTHSLTVGPGASIETAPGSGLYAVVIDRQAGGSLKELTLNGGSIGNFPSEEGTSKEIVPAQSSVDVYGVRDTGYAGRGPSLL